MGKALPGWKEAEPLQSFAALREAFEKLPVTDRCRRLVISEQDALGMCHAAGREVEAREEAERQLGESRDKLQVTSDKLKKAEVKLARSEEQLRVTNDKLNAAERRTEDHKIECDDRQRLVRHLQAELARAQTILGAYREQRANDGTHGRKWDAYAHLSAEDEIVRLEAELEADGISQG